MTDMTIQKAYKFRLYPNKEQQHYFSKVFGSCRYVYNHFLALRIDVYNRKKNGEDLKVPSAFDMNKLLTQLKKETVDENGHQWLYDADAVALCYEIRHLDAAYQSFFRRVKKGDEAPGFPRFKSKYSDRSSYKTSGKNLALDYEHNKIKLPKIGWVKAKLHREIEGRIVSATISKESNGRFFVSLQCDGVLAPVLTHRKKEVAVEVGVEEAAVLSDGTRFVAPKNLEKYEKRLALEQQRLSRMQGANKGEKKSNRFLKQKKKIARIHTKIANARNESQHLISRSIVDNYGVVYLRANDIADMQRNKKEERDVPRFVEQTIHKHISDAAMGELKRKIIYKVEWSGGEVIIIPKDFPSTQTCSVCGFENERLKGIKGLSIREWTCPQCRTQHERETNSATNLLNEGRRIKRRNGGRT